MFIKETSTNIKAEFPQEYAEIVAELNKKGIAESDIEWCYNFCVSLGGPRPIITNQQEAVEHLKTTHSIGVEGSNGRKNKSIRIDTNIKLPKVFEKLAIDNFSKKQIEEARNKTRVSNLDSILKAVGKTGTAEDKNPESPSAVMNGIEFIQFIMQPRQVITYPTIEDIKQVRPDIYEKYELLADGTKLVTFQPGHKECDEWGFIIEEIKLVTKRDNELRFIIVDPYLSGNHYLIRDNKTLWAGNLRGVDKAMAAEEGTNFTGWKRSKQYRLTKKEIAAEIGGKIFENGGLAF